jgi:hypothetical protein
MQAPPSVFSQITSALHSAEFARCAEKFPTQRAPRGLTQYDQFLALCFGQLTYRESLRDIVNCLRSRGEVYHLGFRGRLTRTNLAYANQHRDWRLFQVLAEVLMRRAARLYQDAQSDPDFPKVSFALDSSIISLSLNLFPWGYYARSGQAALKLHLSLCLQGNWPAWAALTEASVQDMTLLDKLPLAPGAAYIMDRGYLDFVRLFSLHQAGAFFVVRSKRHVRFGVRASRPVDKNLGLRCDQTIRLTGRRSIASFPAALRRVRVYDAENKRTLVLLSNHFALPAQTIAELYRRRWQVELFFKWLKQHLRIRSFYGRSINAVKTQVWSAICAYLLVAIAKKTHHIPNSLHEMLQVVSVNIFEQKPLASLFAQQPSEATPGENQDAIQKLFSFSN